MTDVRPRIDGGLPFCSEHECPSFDGKRCTLIGSRPATICEPSVREMRQALMDACFAMNHLGDTLNGMDAAGEDPDFVEVSKRMTRANKVAFRFALVDAPQQIHNRGSHDAER